MEIYRDISKMEAYKIIVDIDREKYMFTAYDESLDILKLLCICKDEDEALKACSDALKSYPEVIITMGNYSKNIIHTHTTVLNKLGIISDEDTKDYIDKITKGAY